MFKHFLRKGYFKQEVKHLCHIWAIRFAKTMSGRIDYRGDRSPPGSGSGADRFWGCDWLDRSREFWEGIAKRRLVCSREGIRSRSSALYSELLIGLDRSHGFGRGSLREDGSALDPLPKSFSFGIYVYLPFPPGTPSNTGFLLYSIQPSPALHLI